MHWFIANLAIATGLAPSVLLNESDRMLNTLYFAVRSQNSHG